jgi:hypothetical protein
MSLQVARITVNDDTPTALITASGRTRVQVEGTCWVGGDDVTTSTGFYVGARTTIDLQDGETLYGITGLGKETASVQVIATN